MPIKHNVTPSTPYASILTAFSGASYPIKIRVSNQSSRKDVFPVVGGIVEAAHDSATNDYALSKKMSLASEAEMQSLAAMIAALVTKFPQGALQFVIEEIDSGSTVDTWTTGYKNGSEWYGDDFSSLSDPDLPLAAAYGRGQLTIGGDVYYANGSAYLRIDRKDVLTGAGTPEGAVTAGIGTLFLRTDGGAGTTLYVKESGTGNTGWIAMATAAV